MLDVLVSDDLCSLTWGVTLCEQLFTLVIYKKKGCPEREGPANLCRVDSDFCSSFFFETRQKICHFH